MDRIEIQFRGCATQSPLSQRRHRAQDRLGVAPRQKAELGASVVEQVKFDVVGAHLQLFLLFFWSKSTSHLPLINRKNRIQQSIPYAFPQRKILLHVSCVEVVEEDPPDTPLFVSMRNIEILF